MKVTDSHGKIDYTAWAKKVVPPANMRGMVTLDLDDKIDRMTIPENPEFTGQYFNTHAQFIHDMGGVINAMLRRWPSGTFFIPYPMTSHLAPVGLVRDILKSGATQVLNVSMYLEGSAENADSSYFAGSGIGALIVNPPHGVDVDLHKHMPGLKIDVFMPAILLPENETEGPLRTYWLNRPDNEQPWDHLNESKKRQTWEYFRKVDWPAEFDAQFEQNVKDGEEAEFDAWLDHDVDGWVDEMYGMIDNPPAPEPLLPNTRNDYQQGVREQSQLQDPVRPTFIRRRKQSAVASTEAKE
jgi:hypothetical protein